MIEITTINKILIQILFVSKKLYCEYCNSYLLIYILVTLVFIRVCLNLKDKTNQGSSYSSRYLQVCIGTLGVHALIALFTNLVTLMSGSSAESLVIAFLIISLYAWFVNGHIFKNAFDTTMTMGLGFSLLHSMICVIFMMLFIQAVSYTHLTLPTILLV